MTREQVHHASKLNHDISVIENNIEELADSQNMYDLMQRLNSRMGFKDVVENVFLELKGKVLNDLNNKKAALEKELEAL